MKTKNKKQKTKNKKKKSKKKDEEVEPRIFDGVMVKIEKYEKSYRSNKDKKSENLNEQGR